MKMMMQRSPAEFLCFKEFLALDSIILRAQNYIILFKDL